MSLNRRKVRVGRVVSDSMDKTIVVSVEWRAAHLLYRKAIRRRSRFKVHDAGNECRIGDLVRLVETRPMSKTKRWKVSEILAREDVAELQPDEIAVDETVMSTKGAITGESALAEIEAASVGPVAVEEISGDEADAVDSEDSVEESVEKEIVPADEAKESVGENVAVVAPDEDSGSEGIEKPQEEETPVEVELESETKNTSNISTDDEIQLRDDEEEPVSIEEGAGEAEESTEREEQASAEASDEEKQVRGT